MKVPMYTHKTVLSFTLFLLLLLLSPSQQDRGKKPRQGRTGYGKFTSIWISDDSSLKRKTNLQPHPRYRHRKYKKSYYHNVQKSVRLEKSANERIDAPSASLSVKQNK